MPRIGDTVISGNLAINVGQLTINLDPVEVVAHIQLDDRVLSSEYVQKNFIDNGWTEGITMQR